MDCFWSVSVTWSDLSGFQRKEHPCVQDSTMWSWRGMWTPHTTSTPPSCPEIFLKPSPFINPFHNHDFILHVLAWNLQWYFHPFFLVFSTCFQKWLNALPRFRTKPKKLFREILLHHLRLVDMDWWQLHHNPASSVSKSTAAKNEIRRFPYSDISCPILLFLILLLIIIIHSTVL